MMKNVPLGVYVKKNTVIHRLPPIVKFGFLITYVIFTGIFVTTWQQAVACVALSTAGYIIAAIPPRITFSQLFPPLPLLITLGLFQWWQLGWEPALRITLVIFSALLMAALLTLTTTVEAMMEALEKALRPMARFGLPVESIVLAISLTMRLLPLMLNTVHEVLDARKARGAGFSLVAFGTPVLIRSIRRARAIADALWARGVGD
ncbi:energy-coupling factor transporter transmembrane protein EcfT [Corynebacterium felinum]|nr:energy-coupling factor transporter transmembrane protein EcfT [Corynebacterium felinum]MDF5820067.1 energy-coupling factor transporter transmembrane protein EcfT [Corynebacterium felinum]